jgi:cytochrome oxidase Cu insertion factor (SCO1/SenC/PrrC family)
MSKQDSRTGCSKSTSFFRQRGFLSSRQALVVLGLIFLAPGFVAWVMHQSGEQGWRPEGMTNQGSLVHPARPLTMPADLVAGDRSLNVFLQGLWTLVYIGDSDCDDVCNENLYKMRQVRTAQNENMKRVQTLYLMQGERMSDSLAQLVQKEYPELTVVPVSAAQAEVFAPFFLIEGAAMQQVERVYFVDPLGNLMMYYEADADPRGMLKDLGKLLKFSKIG